MTGRPASSGGASRWLVLLVMCVGYFLVLLDVTIVNVALPQIGARLGSGGSVLQWVVDGSALALAAPVAAEVVRAAGAGRAAALVFKVCRPIGEQLLVASDSAGVALLGVRPEVAWENLYGMLQTALVAPDAAMPEAHGDGLFGLANALAAMVGGPVVIDDPYMRVLAYSAVDGSVDSVRRDSILVRGLSVGTAPAPRGPWRFQEAVDTFLRRDRATTMRCTWLVPS